MWIILLTVIGFVLYAVMKQKNNGGSETIVNNSIPAEVPGVMHFLRGFHSLCNRHRIISTDVLISWKAVDGGYMISAYTKIFKIDGQDASAAVDILRMVIAQAKRNVEICNKEANPAELYRLKEKAADKVILDFFGTDMLEGSFWDIDDCEYIDGKHLEFEAIGMVYDSFNQSYGKTLDYICSKVAEAYPNAHISRQVNTITISFC